MEIPITNDEITESCDEQFEYSFVSSEENANLPTDVVNVLVRDDDGKTESFLNGHFVMHACCVCHYYVHACPSAVTI